MRRSRDRSSCCRRTRSTASGRGPTIPRRPPGCSRPRDARASSSSRSSCPRRRPPGGSRASTNAPRRSRSASGPARSRSCCRAPRSLGRGTSAATRTTIGVRMPHDPLALAVLARTGPLAVTQREPQRRRPRPRRATRSRRRSAARSRSTSAHRSRSTGSASTVVDLAHGEPSVVRAGAVSERAIAEALRDVATARRLRGPGVDSRPHEQGPGGVHGQRVSVADRRGAPARRVRGADGTRRARGRIGGDDGMDRFGRGSELDPRGCRTRGRHLGSSRARGLRRGVARAT